MDDKKKEIVKSAVGKVEMHDMSRKPEWAEATPARSIYPSIWLTCHQAPFMKGAKAGEEMMLLVKARVCTVESRAEGDDVKSSYGIDVVEVGKKE